MWYHKFEQMLEGAHKMEKLSRMQQRVYDYIAESIAEHGYAPSVREVGEALGLKSPSTVHFHIKHLQEMGLIEKSAGKGRAITLKKQPQEAPAAPVQQAAPAPVVEEGIPGDVVAAIMAAIHAMGNGKYTLKAVRRAANGWSKAGVNDTTAPF